jgi:hypothetical protein
MSFKIFSKSNPCPICNENNGNCRYKLEDTDFIQCHTFVDARKFEKVNGFICVKQSGGGHTASFKPDNSAEWSEQRKLEWEALRVRRQHKAAEEKQQMLSRLLSIPERSSGYRKIASQLELRQHHIASFYQRGLSTEEINFAYHQGWIRSWQPGIEVKGVSAGLAGVTQGLTRSLLGVAGISIAATDGQGHILGHQIGSDDRENFAKYLWLSSKSKGGNSPHLPNGELPLFIWRNPEATEVTETWLVEGSLKSLILALKAWFRWGRTDVQIIGAAGANFDSSSETLKAALSVATTKEVKLFPDAGATSNPYIIKQYEKAWKLAKSLEYKVQFAWWDQLDKKSQLDADELDDLSQVKYILSGDFFAIAEQQINDAEKRKQQEDKRREQEEEVKRLIAERNKLTHITEVPYKVVNVPHMGEVLKDLIEPGTVNIIISDTGTGKSESIIPLAKEAEAVYSWHNRISLGKMLSIILGINYKDDVSRHNKKKAAFCAPSAYQFDPKHLSNKGILLLDECDQVFDFLFGSLCNKDGIRPLLLSTLEGHFEAVIAGKGIALCMSADITQKEIDYIKAVAPEGTPVRLIINKHQPKRPNIYHDPSSTPDGLVDKLIQNLGDRIPCFALDDMKNGVRGCKSLAEYVRTTMPEIADLVLEIHADNSNDPRVQAFFKNPDEESKKYLLIICSPSVVSGISLKNKRFINGVFGFCNGILIDREIKQFLNRVRGAEDIHLWIAEDGFPVRGIDNELTTPEEIKAYYQRNYDVNSKHILSLKPEYEPIKGEWSSPHFELFCKNLAYRIITMKNLRQFTLDHLREIGYGIIEEENIPEGGTKAIEDSLKKIWGDIEISEAEAIAAARFLSFSEMEALEFSTEAIPPELLPAYKKTKMRDYFGEELISATTFTHKKTKRKFTGYAAMALKNVRNDYGRALEAFYLLFQDLSESVGRDFAAEHRQQKRGHGRFVGDVRWNGRKWKCREWLGLKEFLKPGEWWEPKHYQPMVDKAKAHARHVKDALGLSTENITAGQVFGELMRQVGLSFETKSVEGQKWKLRKIKDEDWQYAQMFVRHKEAMKAKEATQATVQTTVQTAVQTVGFTAETLAEVLTLIDTREQYEDILMSNDKAVVDAALALVTQEVRDRILAFYHEPEPLQMSLDDIKTTDSNVVTKENQVQEFPSDTVDDSTQELVKVDEEIKKSAPLCNLHEIPLPDLWARRLNRAVLMSHQIARAIYQMMPQQILDVVWLTLSGGVQNAYCQLFAPG